MDRTAVRCCPELASPTFRCRKLARQAPLKGVTRCPDTFCGLGPSTPFPVVQLAPHAITRRRPQSISVEARCRDAFDFRPVACSTNPKSLARPKQNTSMSTNGNCNLPPLPPTHRHTQPNQLHSSIDRPRMPEVHELKRSLGLKPGEPLGPFTVREVEVSQRTCMRRLALDCRAEGEGRRDGEGLCAAGRWPACTHHPMTAASSSGSLLFPPSPAAAVSISTPRPPLDSQQAHREVKTPRELYNFKVQSTPMSGLITRLIVEITTDPDRRNRFTSTPRIGARLGRAHRGPGGPGAAPEARRRQHAGGVSFERMDGTRMGSRLD